MADVDILLPDGAPAKVPAEDLSRAIAAGAKTQAQADDTGEFAERKAFLRSGVGQAYTGLLGLGRAATFGGSDYLLSKGLEAVGGEEARKGFLDTATEAKELNPVADMAGEATGLVLGGGGIMKAGAAAEGALVGRLGAGIAGKVGVAAARGGVEGALIGAQHSITEDTLGDHALNAEKLFATMGKEAILGGAIGGAFGYAGAKLFGKAGAEATGLAEKTPRFNGPASDAVNDELAGAAGAGRRVKEQAQHLESSIEDFRTKGMTSDEAVDAADVMMRAARGEPIPAAVEEAMAAEVGALPAGASRVEGALEGIGLEAKEAGGVAGALKEIGAAEDVGGAIDAGASRLAKFMAKGNAELEESLLRSYKTSAKLIEPTEAVLDKQAVEMTKKGTKAFRLWEDLDNIQFTEKPDQFRKLVAPELLNEQRDTMAKAIKRAHDQLEFWEGTSAKGGAEGSIKSLRKQLNDLQATMLTGEKDGGEIFVRMNKLKQAYDKAAQWNSGNFGIGEAVQYDKLSKMGFRDVADELRGALETDSIWGGRAAAAQREQNLAYSNHINRKQHFSQNLGVSIDKSGGIPRPEVDFTKTRGLLARLKGGETDELLQEVKSTVDFIDGAKLRIDSLRRTAELSPKELAKLAEGEAALLEFEKAFGAARKEAVGANALKTQQLVEREGSRIGGLLGLAVDTMTKPAEMMGRLGGVKRAADKFSGVIKKGANALVSESKAAAETVAPRAKEATAKDIEEIRSLAGDPIKMGARLQEMTSDLAKYAPKIASEVQAVATRAIAYLAKEAPQPVVHVGLLGVTQDRKPRYSAHALAEWETKRQAALGLDSKSGPELVLDGLRSGRLNRTAIQTVEVVSPKVFAEMQNATREELYKMQTAGTLNKMPMQQQASIASLLHIPPTALWTPESIAMLQASKAPAAAPEQAPGAPAQPAAVSKRAIKFNPAAYATEAQTIEGT